MSFNTCFKFVVISVWLAAMGWLIRYEAFPQFFDPTLQGYREMSRTLPALRDSWMKILSNGEHVGYVNSSIEMTEVEGEEQLQMRTQILIRVYYQGRFELVRLTNEVLLDSRQDLTGSLSTFSAGTYTGSLHLEPIEGSKDFTMTAQLNQMKFKRQISLPPGVVISSPLMDTGLRSVTVGKTVYIRTMDPFSPTGELRTVEVTGISVESRTLPGEERPLDVTLVSIKMGDWDLEAEIDEFGRIVRQETPFGMTFVQSDASTAMKIPKDNALDPVQLLSTSSYPSFMKLPENL